jgi:hypothetical protein
MTRNAGEPTWREAFQTALNANPQPRQRDLMKLRLPLRVVYAHTAIRMLVMGTTVGFVVLLVYGVGPFVRLLDRFVPLQFVQLIIVPTILMFGFFLYCFRCRTQRWYGSIELVTGALLSTYMVNQILGKVSPADGAYLTLAGGLYVIVRGLDNIYKSMTPETSNIRSWNKLFFGKDTDVKL